MNHSINDKFLQSYFVESETLQSMEKVLHWLYSKREAVTVDVQQIPISQMNQW